MIFRAGGDPFAPSAPDPNMSPPVASSSPTMQAVLESYAAHVQGETEQVYAARWIAILGHLRPPEVTVQILRPLLKALLEERKPATVHRAVDVLRAAWNDGRKPGIGLIPRDLENPCDDRKALGLPRVDNLRQAELSAGQEEALIRELGEFWWPYARFSLLTGIRFGNLAGMQWSHVDWDRSFVVLEQVKARKKLPLPLSPEALELLRLQRSSVPPSVEWCWPSERGHQLHKDNFRNRIWKPAMNRAGIPAGTRWHDLRHTMASRLVAATGGDLYVSRDALGHESFRTTERYAHVAEGRVRAAVNLLSKAELRDPGKKERRQDSFWRLFWILRTGYGRWPGSRFAVRC